MSILGVSHDVLASFGTSSKLSHLLQSLDALFDWYRPSGHISHIVEPFAAAYCPASQSKQMDVPFWLDDLPGGQITHDGCPTLPEYFPATQSSHVPPTTGFALPAGHFMQE